MDAFSEVLSGVRLKGAMFFSAEFSAPWRLSTPHSRMLASALAPGAQHLVIYHFVLDGSAGARLEGGPDVELSPGDIVVFPHGDPHHLSGGSGASQVESAAVLRKIAIRDLSPMQSGGGGATTRFVPEPPLKWCGSPWGNTTMSPGDSSTSVPSSRRARAEPSTTK